MAPQRGQHVPAPGVGRDDRVTELLQRLRRQDRGEALQQIL